MLYRNLLFHLIPKWHGQTAVQTDKRQTDEHVFAIGLAMFPDTCQMWHILCICMTHLVNAACAA